MHSPKHHRDEKGVYLLTGVCFEHRPHVGWSPERITEFSGELAEILEKTAGLEAWVVLPNHYHALISTESLGSVLSGHPGCTEERRIAGMARKTAGGERFGLTFWTGKSRPGGIISRRFIICCTIR